MEYYTAFVEGIQALLNSNATTNILLVGIYFIVMSTAKKKQLETDILLDIEDQIKGLREDINPTIYEP